MFNYIFAKTIGIIWRFQSSCSIIDDQFNAIGCFFVLDHTEKFQEFQVFGDYIEGISDRAHRVEVRNSMDDKVLDFWIICNDIFEICVDEWIQIHDFQGSQ